MLDFGKFSIDYWLFSLICVTYFSIIIVLTKFQKVLERALFIY